MYLQIIANITSSAPPPILIRRMSLNALDTITSLVYPIPGVLEGGVGWDRRGVGVTCL